MKETTEYFLRAIEGVRENKQRYKEAEMQAALKPKLPMAGFGNFVSHTVIASGGEDE